MERKRSNDARGGLTPTDNNVNPVNTHVFITVPEEDLGFRGNLKRYGRKCLNGSKENALLIGLLLSVVAGILMGLIIRGTKDSFSKREIMYLGFPGELLMRMLQMLILPIVLSSLISGIAGLDGKTCGRMGLRTIGYFCITTFMAVFLGIFLAITIEPGGNADLSSMRRYGKAESLNSADTFLDLIRNVFPDNLIVTCFNAYRTKEVIKEIVEEPMAPSGNFSNVTVTTPTFLFENTTLANDTEPPVRYHVTLQNEGTGKSNVLGIVTFAILFGVMLGRMGERGKPILAFCDCLVEVTMKLFTVFLWYSPVGIAFLITAKIVEMEDFSVLLGKVGLYFITVLIGLFIHGSVVLPLIYFVLVRKNPYTFIYGISQALATAFGTSSSSATMPVTLKCLEHNNHVDARVASFVIPVGATINMDGTALYEAVAALFIAQVNNRNMNFGEIITISITATAASVGAAGVPQAGLVTMVIVLAAVGLPIDDVTLILVVDWFLDRFRTMTNVMGDSLGAGIVNHYSVDEMPPLEHESHEMEKVPNGQQQETTPV
ncbi:excitatory amino acid transporter 3-like [Physella acuta]|uniref:excitatory amino acid transporter 3-like n=1 Tax=Physella acuta TaxID=109671 RepID=UPI0027DAE9D0|nr:excitatory amino acid transporter 3-like [Physella acuta]